MRKFYFYSNSDSRKEPISTTQAECLIDAEEFFAERKQLSIYDFLELFTVESDEL